MENKAQGKIIEGLQFAIQMEIDGKEYYQKAGKECESQLSRELFEWLSGEEDKHRKKFEDIYKAIKSKQVWPDIEIIPGKGKKLETFFEKARKTANQCKIGASYDLNAIDKAMDMENKTHIFYTSQGKNSHSDAEKKFYEAIAIEEKGHYLALVDFKEYLTDPADWFTRTERHSLDGG